MHSRPRILRCWLVFIFLLAVCGPASAGDWPRFRGPNGDGIASDKDVPIKWTDENILWKTPIPGVGHSSPIVCKGCIFLQSASEDGSERWLLSLDARKGEIIWKTRSPGASARKHVLNSFASSTPATDGERVYAAFWDGTAIHLGAYGFKEGKPIWQKNLGGFKSQHGFGHSPMVLDGKVILANDQDGAAHLLAFDAKNGNKLWQTERKPYRACYSTPIVHVRADGEKELIVASTAGITGYNPADGQPNWWYTWKFGRKPLRTVASPILVGDLVIATSGDGDGSRDAIAVKIGDKGDASAGNPVWENRTRVLFPYVPCFLAHDRYLFGVNDNGVALCYLAKSGEEVWRQERLSGGFTASPVLINGSVYAVSRDGSVSVFKASAGFELLARNNLGEAVSSSPAVADNCLFIRGEKHLFCIGKPAAKSAQRGG